MDGDRLSAWRRFRRYFFWHLAGGLFFLGKTMPLSIGRMFGQRLAKLAFKLRPVEASRAAKNLLTAFPELDAASRDQLLESAVEALGKNLFDTLAAPRLLDRTGCVACGCESETSSEPGENAQAPSTMDVLSDLADQKKGVLVLTGHLGCWELLGGWLAKEIPAAGLGELGVVTGTIHNEPLDRMVQNRRRGMGMKVFPRDGGIRPLLEHLNSGGVLAVLLDQNTRVNNFPVPFFGKPAPTAAGIARIVHKKGIPVLPVSIAQNGDGHLVRHLKPIIPGPAQESLENSDPVFSLLVRFNRALEDLIRRNPSEWVWFHQRWDEQNTESVAVGVAV